MPAHLDVQRVEGAGAVDVQPQVVPCWDDRLHVVVGLRHANQFNKHISIGS